jgi:thiol-disulfide isomerase/thioredoxin
MFSAHKTFIRTLCIAAIGFIALAVNALTIDDYSPAAVKKAQSAGKSYALAFHADWCPTCRAQAKVFEQLKSDSALKNVTIYSVDYDGETELKKQLKVRGQSTIIVYKGAKEVSRSVADTSQDGLKKLLVQSR